MLKRIGPFDINVKVDLSPHEYNHLQNLRNNGLMKKNIPDETIHVLMQNNCIEKKMGGHQVTDFGQMILETR